MIEVGKTYKTRNGWKAGPFTVDEKFKGDKFNYYVAPLYKPDGSFVREDTWPANGHYDDPLTSELDLVREEPPG